MKTLFSALARYNRAMNAQMMLGCDGLSDGSRKEDCGAWFRSVHGTWNHILVADKLWMGRFTATPFSVPSLDFELHASWSSLKRERALCDDEIVKWTDALPAERLGEVLEFTAMSRPGLHRLPMWLALSHFFNHQTHHRGQITTLMNQLGVDSGATDLPFFEEVTEFAWAHGLAEQDLRRAGANGP